MWFMFKIKQQIVVCCRCCCCCVCAGAGGGAAAPVLCGKGGFVDFFGLNTNLINIVMDRRESQRKKFYSLISSDGRFLFTLRKLKHYIKRVIKAKEGDRKKSPGDYALLNRYDVARIGEDTEILIKKNSIDPYIRYISETEVFDVIYDAHVNVCHGGQKRTYCEVKRTVANVTRKQVALFLSFCITCEEKRSIKKNKRVIRPIKSSDYSERGQVDLIDMRSSKTRDNYCFILHYQDHFTKFSVLKALHSKQTSEVSHHLYDIFTLIGAPKILQSDNGNEFVGAPLTSMMQTFWPETELIRGSPRHPQSQGSVEKANGDVKMMLCGLMREKNTCNWVDLLKQVQWTKNTVNHRVIGMSPYEAVFGQKHASPMKIIEQETDQEGIEHQQLQPCDQEMEIEEEDEEGEQQQQRRHQPCDQEVGTREDEEGEQQQQRRHQPCDQEVGTREDEEGEQQQQRRHQPCDQEVGTREDEEGEQQQHQQLQPCDQEVGTREDEEGETEEQEHQQQLYNEEVDISEEEESVEEEDQEEHVNETVNEQRLENFIKIRQRVRNGIEQQASKMIKTTSSSSLHPEINDCVNVTVPQIDRPRKMSMQNFVGVIVAIDEKKGHKLYNVATKYGCIRPLLSRNQFEICRRRNVMDIETVDRERAVSIRKIAAAEAIKGSEEPSSNVCHCATDYCRTMRCFCKRSGILCTERCKHGRNPKTGRINQEIAANFKCCNK
nr:MAG: integrase-like protein [Hemigrapsus takanoi nimavirus]